MPRALACPAPIVAGILLFHFLMEHYSLALGIIPLLLWTFMMWQYRSHFTGLFVRKAKAVD